MGLIADLLKEIPSAARYKAELESMEKKVVALESENKALREEIQRRDDVIQKERSHGQRLEEIREQMLALIAKQEGITETAIAAELNINSQLARFHLQELSKAGFAGATLNMDGGPGRWGLMQEGRGYLASHGLLA